MVCVISSCVLSPSWSPAVCSPSLFHCPVPSFSPSAPHHLISLVSSLVPSLSVGASVFALTSVLCLLCLLCLFLGLVCCLFSWFVPHVFFWFLLCFFSLLLFYFPLPAFRCQFLSHAISLFTFLGFLDLSLLKLAFWFQPACLCVSWVWVAPLCTLCVHTHWLLQLDKRARLLVCAHAPRLPFSVIHY